MVRGAIGSAIARGGGGEDQRGGRGKRGGRGGRRARESRMIVNMGGGRVDVYF